MHIRSPIIRLWVLYGILLSIIHLYIVWRVGLVIDAGVVTGRLTTPGDYLTFPGVWVLHKLGPDGFDIVPAMIANLYPFLYLIAFFLNTAAWGFGFASVVVFLHRRAAPRYFQLRKPPC